MSTMLQHESHQRDDATRARGQYKSGWSLPAYHYLSQECYQRELATMRENLWFLAGHETQIPKTGDYRLFTFAQESIILVRDKTGVVNAFYNVCRHRGSIICREAQGNAKLLVCPYHAWTYRLDGTLIPPRSMPKDFNPSAYSLLPCHLRIEDGMLFVSLATGTPPDFEAFMSPIRPFLRPYAIGRTRVVAEERTMTSSNWKIGLANAVECYHCPNAHRSMSRIIQIDATSDDVPDEKGETWSSRMQRLGRHVDPLMDDASSDHLRSAFQTPFQRGYVSGSMDGKAVSKLVGDLTEWSGGWVFMSFNPFVHAALFDDYVHLFYYTPIDVGKTEITLLWLVRDDAVEGTDYDVPALTKLMSLVISEDNQITDGNQRGITSCAYMPTPLSTEEDRVVLFHDWYVRHFLGRDGVCG